MDFVRKGKFKIRKCFIVAHIRPCVVYHGSITMLLCNSLLYFRFYCELNSNRSDSIICPVGNYCPMGSGLPTPCPRGTYTNTLGLVHEDNCTACDSGMYCNDTGNVRLILKWQKWHSKLSSKIPPSSFLI